METFERVRQIVGKALRLGDRIHELNSESALLGGLPEFDSVAVVDVITAIEEQMGISIDDDDISGETFETFASLTAFVEEKLRSTSAVGHTKT